MTTISYKTKINNKIWPFLKHKIKNYKIKTMIQLPNYTKISHPNRLSQDEEAKLIISARHDINAKNEVFKRYSYIIHEVGAPYMNEDNIDDLLQEGYLGIDRAIKEFDPTRGKRFSTCAVGWIKDVLSNYYRINSRPFEVPRTITDKLYSLNKFENSFELKNNRSSNNKEKARELGIPESKLNYLLKYSHGTKSLDEEVGSATRGEEHCDQLKDKISDGHSDSPADRLLREDSIKRIKELFLTLSKEEQIVLSSRYDFFDTLENEDCQICRKLPYKDIAEMLSKLSGETKSASQIKKIQERAEEKLRNLID